MSELDEVLDALQAGQGRGVALATVVALTGSSYRREGARMVVGADGPAVGSVSAGCLDQEIADRARHVLATGRPSLLHFDLSTDDEVWGWGLGCDGTIDVLVEPGAGAALLAPALRAARLAGRPLALITRLEGRVGDRVVVQPDGRLQGSLGARGLDRQARALGVAALAGGGTRTSALPGGGRVLVEALEPPTRLVVCGAGHDALPLVEFGARLGWSVAVVDDRPGLLTDGRFSGAGSVVRAEPRAAAAAVGIDSRSCVVVMSHDRQRDREYLRSFLGERYAYLGVVGPRSRLEALLEELRGEGVEPSEEASGRLYGPAGLDIGAEGPDEVAWAIVAEILAAGRRTAAGFLRDRRGPIHRRLGGGDDQR